MIIRFATCNQPAPETGRKVAIVGSGPAGIAAASQLRCLGHKVSVFDRLPEPGGMLLFAIPDFRIPKANVRESIKAVAQMGVDFYNETEAGRNLKIDELLEDYHAVLISTGTWKGKKLNVPGEDKGNVYNALDWIFHFMSYKLGYVKTEPPELRGRVGVVGAGLTAVDVAELAVHEYGAKPVLIYRRPMSVAPAKHMLKHLEELGVGFLENVIPVEVLGGNKIESLRLVRVKPTTSRTAKTEIIPGSEFEIELDSLVVAVGLDPTPPPGLREIGAEISPNGSIKIDENYMTTVKGLFAAGDVAHGPSNIGLAMRSGRLAAQKISEWLGKNK
ncbi:FAD-dependent oxidoreductase [Thermofilum sp.]|jgi:glutamate synthase (NADPH/NADH) small chain|uniref:FAD-dependent oxidoreductase n=1 Tax=Thermofilum sp. TaxID=1961369 RepID=UPI00258C034E|nr:FAD-dependent oxidoreductase [Thermofilum sp.]